MSAPHDWNELPLRLFARHMARVYDVGLQRFYKLENEGAFIFAEIRPRVGRKSWSRDRVKAHFDGTLVGLRERPKRMARVQGPSKRRAVEEMQVMGDERCRSGT